MGRFKPRSNQQLIVVTFLVVVLVLTLVTPASADHEECSYDPAVGALVCPGHEGGGPGDPGNDLGYYYTEWQFLGVCDWTDSLQFRRYKIYTDGVTPAELEDVCVVPDPGSEGAWAGVAEAIAALADPVWLANPDGTTSSGLTGLETWLWYPNPTRVGPIGVIWTDPVTGIISAVEGRGWVRTLTWGVGEGENAVSAGSFDAAASIGGSEAQPAATHVYNTTSTAAGFSDGYPVSVTLLWIGETRIRPPGSPWFSWTPIGNTLTNTATDIYEVVEVRSSLSG